MTKNILLSIIVIIFVGGAVWFFMRKINSTSSSRALPSTSSVLAELRPSTSPSMSPSEIPMDRVSGQELVIGKGEAAKNGDTVTVNYTGTLIDGKKFDSSYDHGQPFSFTIGAGEVIKGWDIGVAGMKVGGKRQLIIPPVFGYGDRDMGNGAIPPNSILVFEVELLSIKISPK